MNRIDKLFQSKNRRVLNVYCTAGFPQIDSTLKVMSALEASGADIIELGMPYSDPLADGPVIQQSSTRAIQNGMTIATLFDQLTDFRNKINIPVILMGYMNPALQFGFENFCRKASEAGVDGLIIPDLPMYEYEREYKAIIEKYNLHFIFLVTPETSDERIKMLDALSTGFLYAVSSSSTTGNEKKLEDQQQYFERLASLGLRNPILIGFGIKDRQTFDTACRYTNGAIIGSAFIKALDNGSEIESTTRSFLGSILKS